MRLLFKKCAVVLVVPLLFSCATYMNKPVQKISIATDRNIKVLSVQNAIATDSSSSTKEYFVPRSNQPLVVVVQADTSVKQIFFHPKSSAAFWLNTIENFGIGMLVDRDNPKRYSYPATNYFSMTDTGIKISRFAPVEKGTINFSFSLPFMVNAFSIKTPEGQYNSGGVYGVKTGLDYFYKRNHYLSVGAGIATDVFGEYFLFDSGFAKHAFIQFVSLKNYFVVGNFDFGYGVHVSQFKWKKIFGDTTKTDLTINNTGLGPALSMQYRVGKNFRLGIFYQPLLLNTRPVSFAGYQHYFSFDLMWKFAIRRPSAGH